MKKEIMGRWRCDLQKNRVVESHTAIYVFILIQFHAREISRGGRSSSGRFPDLVISKRFLDILVGISAKMSCNSIADVVCTRSEHKANKKKTKVEESGKAQKRSSRNPKNAHFTSINRVSHRRIRVTRILINKIFDRLLQRSPRIPRTRARSTPHLTHNARIEYLDSECIICSDTLIDRHLEPSKHDSDEAVIIKIG